MNSFSQPVLLKDPVTWLGQTPTQHRAAEVLEVHPPHQPQEALHKPLMTKSLGEMVDPEP